MPCVAHARLLVWKLALSVMFCPSPLFSRLPRLLTVSHGRQLLPDGRARRGLLKSQTRRHERRDGENINIYFSSSISLDFFFSPRRSEKQRVTTASCPIDPSNLLSVKRGCGSATLVYKSAYIFGKYFASSCVLFSPQTRKPIKILVLER